MASRHDIIHIDFQANAGKANVALQALQSEAERARQKVEGLRNQLQNARNTNMPIADIQKLEKELATATKEAKQWQSALNNNMKGVRALDEAIKMFNKGKGSVEDMNAALSKTALNAANLQKSRSAEGSKTWKEMDALIVALSQNIARCNTATNSLVATIKQGGTASRDTLTKAKSDLQQMIALEEQGSNGWKKYSAQLKVVEGELNRINAEEQRMAGQNALAKVFSGQYITKSTSEIEKLIAAVRQYQSTIADPEGKGARHFRATETALKKLSEQLGKTKGDIVTVQQALKVAGAAGVANQFGTGLAAQQTKLAEAYNKTATALAQMQQKRQTYTIIQQNGLLLTAQEQAMLAQLDAQIATTTAQLERERQAMIQAGEANNLTNKSITQSIQVLRQQQQTVAEGSVNWKKYGAAIAELEEREKIMRGEAMALNDAMKLASTAGRQGFAGTAKQLQLAQQAIEKAATTAKKGSPEWLRYQQALARVRVEMQNAGITSERMQKILDRPANAKNLQELQAAVKRAKAELDLMAGTVGKTSKAYADMAAKTKTAEQQLKTLQAQSHGTATAFGKAWSRLKTYISLYVGAAVAMQKIMATFGDLMKLSDKLGEVRKTTGFTADEVGRLSDKLRELDTRTDLVSLMSTAAKAGQLGLKTIEDVRGFTEAANMLMVALPEMGEEAATQMMKVATATGEVDKIRKQMEEGTIEGTSAVAVAMTKIGSTIDQLRANSAAAAPAITDFVKRVGAVGAQSGITIDQVAALGSTVDALGMRVEMSATALSRMLPAIKNNAFSIAKSIGVTPETIRELFDTGRGMEAILMIFQHIKDTGKDADSIEQMLGMNGMQDIMKELNQQGARAGIVFAGLSQNVDTLREHLGIAKTAYEENIAIMNEYNKMNETTAAKWERLKNQVEEAFVSDQTQKALGWIIDRLRFLVDLLTGRVGPALDFIGILMKTILVRWALVKLGIGEALLITLPKALATFKATAVLAFSTIGTQIKAATFYLGLHTMATKRAAVEMRKMNAAQMANFWMALALAIGYAAKALYDWSQRFNKTAGIMAEAEANLAATTRQVGALFSKYKQLSEKQQELTRTTKSLKDREEELKKEVEALRKKMGDGAEQSEVFKKKQEELSKAHEEVAKSEGKASDATNKRLGLINEINSKYSTYLGYMLSEASTAETVASAHDLIIAALKEEMYWRQQNNAFKTVTEEHGDKLKKYREKSLSEMEGDNVDAMRQQNIMTAWQEQLSQVTYDASKGGYQLMPGGKTYATIDQALEGMKERFNTVLSTEGGYYMVHTNDKKDRLEDWWGGGLDDGFKDWTEESLKVLKEASMLQGMAGGAAKKAHEASVEQARSNTNALISQAQTRGEGGTVNNRQVAEAIVGIQKNLSKYGEIAGSYQQFAADTSLKGIANVLLKDLPADTRKAVESEMERVAANGITPPKPTPTKNPWGSTPPAESTDYKDMAADVLVNRRKQMKDFVNAIQTDTDVQSVLKEDAALKKAIEAGMSSDMRTVIEWYNTERLKIQDELHARHLTNTGDWMDPKKERGAKKQFRDEMDAYLHELDAYYTERKTRIEQARNDEEITEGEAWRRTIQNENEWQTRRAELQKLYSRKQQEVTQEELDAILHIIAERTGDSESFVKAAIAKTNQFVDAIEKSGDKGAAIVHRWMSQVVLDTERSYLKAAQAIGKQMKFIEDTLAKERPYDSITKNMQDNLDKMGVLAAKMRRVNDELTKQGKEPKYSNEDITAQSYKEMSFYLQQAEDAYRMDIDELLRRMAQEGMAATADEISKSDMLKQAVMGQLRKAYQEVHDAIKKEASQIKKDVELLWNDETLGPDGKSIKSSFDKVIAQLGMQQDSVSRTNSLIGAGPASDNVASRIAMKQLQVQMDMQRAQFNMFRTQANQRMAALKAEAKEHERIAEKMKQEGNMAEYQREILAKTTALRAADNVRRSLGLTLAEETKKEEELQAELLKQQEEIQNRLYKDLREWADLLTSSIQGVFEASHAGDAEYYNELAKLNLTGKGGPGAGTYVVIDNEGTSEATAHYEYLDERQALEREHEIEQQNAQAEAWRKLMDDLNMKMSETITDQLNAMLQNQSIDANTDALLANTQAIYDSMGVETPSGEAKPGQSDVIAVQPQPDKPSAPVEPIVISGGSEPVVTQPSTDPENTAATNANTAALNTLTQVISGQPAAGATDMGAAAGGGTTATAEGDVELQKPFFQMTEEETALAMERIRQLWQAYNEGGVEALQEMAATLAETEGIVLPPWQITEEQLAVAMDRMQRLWQSYAQEGIAAMQQMSDAMEGMSDNIPNPMQVTEEQVETSIGKIQTVYKGMSDASSTATGKVVENQNKINSEAESTNQQMTRSTQSAFSKMIASVNMYGIAYQTMSNDNLDMTQKVGMMILQTTGQVAMAALNVALSKAFGESTASTAAGNARSYEEAGPYAAPLIIAAMSGLLGGMMGLAASEISSSKSKISQITGVSTASAGRLATGMLTYAEGNVNEFTDPASLTPGRQYNVDGADGKTYRARYMGKDAKTHITNGPEFHLVGEKGREAIIDAHTTRLMQTDDTGIWQAIQTLYNGGTIARRRTAGYGGMRAFAEGNIGDFEDVSVSGMEGMGDSGIDMAAMMDLLDRNRTIQEALLERLQYPLTVAGTGPEGVVAMYDKLKKEAQRHGVKYL